MTPIDHEMSLIVTRDDNTGITSGTNTSTITSSRGSIPQSHCDSTNIQSLRTSQLNETRKKIKTRMSRSMKTARKQQRETVAHDQDHRLVKENPILKSDISKTLVTFQSITDKLMISAKEAQRTGAVSIVHQRLNDERKVAIAGTDLRRDDIKSCNLIGTAENDMNCKIRVVTNCLDSPFEELNSKSPQMIVIKIKPLLILDLNGILCHRIRPSREFRETKQNRPEQFFREIVANVANTQVVARPDLDTLLEYLSAFFCLAIWTSAKARTANVLLKTLFPENIANKLLFVWAQHDCQRTSANGTSVGDDVPFSDDVVFVKDIQHVWNKYPLWNTNNTLLVDDSPEKCFAWKENAVHPPPMNGLKAEIKSISMFSETLLDYDNAKYQRMFFENLVDHWSKNDLVQDWDTECDDSIIFHRTKNQTEFLRTHAVEHMGWSSNNPRTPSK